MSADWACDAASGATCLIYGCVLEFLRKEEMVLRNTPSSMKAERCCDAVLERSKGVEFQWY